jgi:hypothetical protein
MDIVKRVLDVSPAGENHRFDILCCERLISGIESCMGRFTYEDQTRNPIGKYMSIRELFARRDSIFPLERGETHDSRLRKKRMTKTLMLLVRFKRLGPDLSQLIQDFVGKGKRDYLSVRARGLKAVISSYIPGIYLTETELPQTVAEWNNGSIGRKFRFGIEQLTPAYMSLPIKSRPPFPRELIKTAAFVSYNKKSSNKSVGECLHEIFYSQPGFHATEEEANKLIRNKHHVTDFMQTVLQTALQYQAEQLAQKRGKVERAKGRLLKLIASIDTRLLQTDKVEYDLRACHIPFCNDPLHCIKGAGVWAFSSKPVPPKTEEQLMKEEAARVRKEKEMDAGKTPEQIEANAKLRAAKALKAAADRKAAAKRKRERKEEEEEQEEEEEAENKAGRKEEDP